MSDKDIKSSDFNVRAFLVCLAISTGLWLIIELSEQFNTQGSFTIELVDAPTDQLITNHERQTMNFSMQADGFQTLWCKFFPDSKRVAQVSLAGVPYRLEDGNTYSFSSQYVAENIAKILDISSSDITMNDDKVYFIMEPMKSKVVPVLLLDQISTQQSYEVYGLPIIEPATITVYGPQEVLDTLKAVPTNLLKKSEVCHTLQEVVDLNLGNGLLHCDVKKISVTIEVLQFTEQELEIPISVPDSLNMRLVPETVKVKYTVAMKDYPSMNTDMFKAEIDPMQIDPYHTLLDVSLTKQPNNIELLSIDPQRVEYLIVK